MAKQEKAKEESVSVEVGETVYDPKAELGSENNPMRFLQVYPEPSLANPCTGCEVDETDEERIRNSLWRQRDLAESIAQQILANPDSRNILQGSVMATGKAGDYHCQARLLAAKSFSYAKQLLDGLEEENEAEIAKQLKAIEASKATEAGGDKSESEE